MSFLTKTLLFPLFLFLILLSCKEYGDQVTGSKPVRLTTKAAEDISATSAWSGGNISNDGGAVILDRGVVWSTSRNPTVSLPTKTSEGKGSGSFSSRMTGLLPRTTYFVRAYATNRSGTEYGNEISFDTETDLPTLTTTPVSGTTTTSVISGGTILKDGGLPILDRGVVWNTTGNPTVSLPSKTSDGKGAGNYSSPITGLTPGTVYFLRAYATNSAGTAYGNEIRFETEAPWDELEEALTQKMDQYDIPGLSIAVTRNEKLVYLKSFGYSDKEANKIASNEDLYRIADASKILTWIATLRLVDDYGSPLDDIVFGSNSILGKDYPAPPIGSGKNSLTVQNFLEHTSGWTNSPYDPMLVDNTLTQSQIIRDILLNRPLTYAPGTTYYDLNFGYCVLGRVIEKVTNMPYENYVKSIMNDFGVLKIKLGGNTLRERLPQEVKYYQSEKDPYSLNIKKMDAHGGWIASAKDLAKIMVRIDGNLNVQDVFLTAPSTQIYTGSTWVQYGSLPGSSSILHRLDGNYSFILLTNTRTENDPSQLLKDLDNVVIQQIRSRPSWPSYDLF